MPNLVVHFENHATEPQGLISQVLSDGTDQMAAMT